MTDAYKIMLQRRVIFLTKSLSILVGCTNVTDRHRTKIAVTVCIVFIWLACNVFILFETGGVTHSFKLHPVAFVDIGLDDALVCFLYMVFII